MNRVHRVSRHLSCCAAALAASGHAAAQAVPGAAVLTGRYGIDCSDPAAPRLRVSADALKVDQGTQRMTGRPVQAAAAPAADAVLSGPVQGGPALRFTFRADKAGPFVTLDGDALVRAALGEALLKARFRRCDPLLPSEPPAVARQVGGIQPGKLPDLPTLIDDPSFKRAYLRALGPKVVERWLSSFDGPAQPPRHEVVRGTRYIVASFCKAHDCADNNALLLYAVPTQQLFGLVQLRGRKALLGDPPAELTSELERLWAREVQRL